LVEVVLTVEQMVPDKLGGKIEDFCAKNKKSTHIIGGLRDDRRR
jgi:hypothetical protein